jgi:hypothetical protein
MMEFDERTDYTQQVETEHRRKSTIDFKQAEKEETSVISDLKCSKENV